MMCPGSLIRSGNQMQAISHLPSHSLGLAGGSGSKESACHAGDLGSIPVSRRSLSLDLRYPCLGNPTDRGAWRATVHGVSYLGGSAACPKPPSALRVLTCWGSQAARVPSRVSAPGRGLPPASSPLRLQLTLTEGVLHARPRAV